MSTAPDPQGITDPPIDELLDKISQHGLHSLTDSERKELNKLRERRNSR